MAAACLAVLALFVLAELGLRAAGLGAPPPGRESSLSYQHLELPVLGPAVLPDGRAVLETRDPRLAYQWVLAEKPPGGLRVCVFGGSATAGLGMSPVAAFPEQLARLLAAVEPERPIEVLNLGMVAQASTGVRALVEDVCAHADPDLLVVYSGNNEFLELHSLRYFECTASFPARARAGLGRLHSVRLARRALRGPEPPRPITSREIAAGDQRIDHRQMMEEVEIGPGEVRAIEELYADNLRAMVAAARAADVDIVLATVASNWRWWGLEDIGPAGGEPASEHERLFRAGLAREAAADWAGAAEALRAAVDADPHLRRASSALAERVRAVGAESGAPVFDALERLAARAPHGILGFETFYDYVHFTPEGAFAMAAELWRFLADGALVPGAAIDPRPAVEAELASACAGPDDGIAVARWIGFGDDPARLGSRDLWKYDRLVDELDRRIAADPRDALARAWRGNVHFFECGGAESARAAYAASLAIEELPGVRENLRRLDEGRAWR